MHKAIWSSMDSSSLEDDQWDSEDFVIPSLGIEISDSAISGNPQPEPKSPSPKADEEIHVYLGPHGAPPSQVKQQELNIYPRRKQHFKNKLKEADERVGGTGRENKLENIRELVGGRNVTSNMPKGSDRDWLDPHCNESEFEKRHRP